MPTQEPIFFTSEPSFSKRKWFDVLILWINFKHDAICPHHVFLQKNWFFSEYFYYFIVWFDSCFCFSSTLINIEFLMCIYLSTSTFEKAYQISILIVFSRLAKFNMILLTTLRIRIICTVKCILPILILNFLIYYLILILTCADLILVFIIFGIVEAGCWNNVLGIWIGYF